MSGQPQILQGPGGEPDPKMLDKPDTLFSFGGFGEEVIIVERACHQINPLARSRATRGEGSRTR